MNGSTIRLPNLWRMNNMPYMHLHIPEDSYEFSRRNCPESQVTENYSFSGTLVKANYFHEILRVGMVLNSLYLSHDYLPNRLYITNAL